MDSLPSELTPIIVSYFDLLEDLYSFSLCNKGIRKSLITYSSSALKVCLYQSVVLINMLNDENRRKTLEGCGTTTLFLQYALSLYRRNNKSIIVYLSDGA